jgi:hypothetical protein
MSNVRRLLFSFLTRIYSPYLQEDTRPGAELTYTRLVGSLPCTLFARGRECGSRKPALYNGSLGVVGGVPPPTPLGFPRDSGTRPSPPCPSEHG